jgi:hypothetical protein
MRPVDLESMLLKMFHDRWWDRGLTSNDEDNTLKRAHVLRRKALNEFQELEPQTVQHPDDKA